MNIVSILEFFYHALLIGSFVTLFYLITHAPGTPPARSAASVKIVSILELISSFITLFYLVSRARQVRLRPEALPA